ncbi:MAG: type II secretion system protein N [Endozoicomonas sp.]|uniref:type II secretion system protein N n=1 Tax=Endozoicomonas sp. TaxID=1892382 RepID=UPI003D9B369D
MFSKRKLDLFVVPVFALLLIALIAWDSKALLDLNDEVEWVGDDVATAQSESEPVAEISQKDLLENPLFSLYEPSEQKSVELNNIPKTSLKLSLEAIFRASSQDRNAAQIGTEAGSRLFRVGDNVSDDVIVKAIGSRTVTLEIAGALENLSFDNTVESQVVSEPPKRSESVSSSNQLAVTEQGEIAERLEALRARFSDQQP